VINPSKDLCGRGYLDGHAARERERTRAQAQRAKAALCVTSHAPRDEWGQLLSMLGLDPYAPAAKTSKQVRDAERRNDARAARAGRTSQPGSERAAS
jgi:phosphoglycolate phosphatase-like HAD superfamily hydrolase